MLTFALSITCSLGKLFFFFFSNNGQDIFFKVKHCNSQCKSSCEDLSFLWIFAEDTVGPFTWDLFLLCVSLTTKLFLSRAFNAAVPVVCGSNVLMFSRVFAHFSR